MPDPSTGPGSPRAQSRGDWTPHLASRLASLRLSPAREQEIVEELSQHLDDIYHERRSAGDSHEEAVRRALDEIEESDLLAREMRPLRQADTARPIPAGGPSLHFVSDTWHDVAYACRTLLASRLPTAVILLLLALGIGANAAIFSAADAAFFASLPVNDPDTLVRLRWSGQNDAANEHMEYGYRQPGPDGEEVYATFSYPTFQEMAKAGRDEVNLFACAPLSQLNLIIDDRADLVDGLAASGNYFSVLGVRPALGRLLVPDDDRPSAPPAAVISSRFWQVRFGGDPSVVGRVIVANDTPVTIVGVTPADFAGVQDTMGEAPDITFPLSLDLQLRASAGRAQPSLLPEPTAWWLQVMGRVHPGITAARVQSRLDGVFQATARANLGAYLESLTDAERGTAANRERKRIPRLLVDSGRRGIYDADTRTITAGTVLSAVVLVILLIICANVANLMLSRAIGRQKEMAVRLSLGATRARLVRQFLTEAFVLAIAGGALGLAVASWGVGLLPAPMSQVHVFHERTFLFTLLATVLTSALFGAVPALRASRVDVNSRLKEGGRGIAGRRNLLARGLLVVQVALSLVLLIGAGLFLQTLQHLRSVDPGFDPKDLVLVWVNPTLAGYDMPRTVGMYGRLLERFEGIPGVRGAALSQPALLSGSTSMTSFYVHGHEGPASVRGPGRPFINLLVVSPSFCRVMGIPLVRGRDLTDHDDGSAPKVALINEAAVRKYFPGEDALGKRFGSQPERASEIEIVGIVKDARYSSPREDPPPTMYVSYPQAPRAVATFELRTAAEPAAFAGAVRDAVREVDPNLPIISISTQTERIEMRFSQERLFAHAYSLFGGIALLLASVGLFGLMSYNVARRTAEMGIRMALGARRRDVVGMVMRESLPLVGAGVIAGLLVAAASGRLVSALLYGLPPGDVPTIAAAIVVMAIVSAVAAYLPARRASRVDPLVALRYE